MAFVATLEKTRGGLDTARNEVFALVRGGIAMLRISGFVREGDTRTVAFSMRDGK